MKWSLLAMGIAKGFATLGGTPATDQVLLFVDESAVLYRSGTERVIQPLQRYGQNPVIRGRENPWETALAWTSVYRNPASGKYQLWYQSFAGNAASDRTRRCTVAYAESDDGIQWIKPKLGLFDFNGIKDTNIVLVANGGHSDRYGGSVIVDPKAQDPARRYKMAYFDWAIADDGHEYPGLNVAFSQDGIHWNKYPHEPRLHSSYGRYGDSVPLSGDHEHPWSVPLAIADAQDAFYDPVRQVYALYGKMWIDAPDGGMFWKHAMGRSESKDFIQWSQPELILTPDENDAASVEFHTTPVFYYEGCYFSPLQILNRAVHGGVIDIELATSRDGIAWERNFRRTLWLQRQPGNQFDSGSLLVSPQPIVLPNEIRFYYGGYSGGATGSDDMALTTGIGFATIPRDRFAGIQPVAESDQPTLKQTLHHIGQVTLRPLTFVGDETLELNANAAHGTVQVELLSEDGRRVPGYLAEDAVPIQGDDLRHRVSWKSPSAAHLPAGRYLVRLHLDNAAIYALTIRH